MVSQLRRQSSTRLAPSLPWRTVAIKIVANDFQIPDQSLKFQQQLDKFYVFKINPAALRLGLYGKHDGIELSLEISYVRFFLVWCLSFSDICLSSSVELKKLWCLYPVGTWHVDHIARTLIDTSHFSTNFPLWTSHMVLRKNSRSWLLRNHGFFGFVCLEKLRDNEKFPISNKIRICFNVFFVGGKNNPKPTKSSHFLRVVFLTRNMSFMGTNMSFISRRYFLGPKKCSFLGVQRQTVSWSSRMIGFRCILTSSQTMSFGDPPLKKLVLQKWGHLGHTVDGWNPAPVEVGCLSIIYVVFYIPFFAGFLNHQQ